MTSRSDPATVAARADMLVAAFREVETTRMAGLPLLHPRLRVEAVDFQHDAADPSVALGVLVTPWFMNLVRLPLDAATEQALAGVGERRTRAVAALPIDFLGAYEPAFGRFEACSLFSPMAEFVDQAAAVATAREVLGQLRAAPAAPPAAVPDRRAFLFGRRAAEDRPRP
ncbi:MAG TPA: [NiFe]-hydrogenase assembly chaperone HybE [Methylibium sp.]|nr:[NiFe]-hydrogenase assembly chaperone HybE [Methylibium sp.]